MPTLICIRCKHPFFLNSYGTYNCEMCDEKVYYTKHSIKTYPDYLLFKNFKKSYLENKVLNNNAIVSYEYLPSGSISLPERKDVKRFSLYLGKNLVGHNILDIGCGTMSKPGYFFFEGIDNYNVTGIDPLEGKSFFGTRIVGCSEYLPFEDNSFDNIVFATSLDHVVSITKTLNESYRVLTKNGKVHLWISDRSTSFLKKIKNFITSIKQSYIKGYNVNKYFVYENFTVLGVPNGAVDPFHSFNESPKLVKKLFYKTNFNLQNEKYLSKNEIFLSFSKN